MTAESPSETHPTQANSTARWACQLKIYFGHVKQILYSICQIGVYAGHAESISIPGIESIFVAGDAKAGFHMIAAIAMIATKKVEQFP